MKQHLALDLARTPGSRVISTLGELATVLRTSDDAIEDFVARKLDHYTSFKKAKPNGTFRTIEPPKPALRAVLRRMLEELYARLRIPVFLHGGVPRRTTLTHAKIHVGQELVATFDLKNFFPSVRPDDLRPILWDAGIRGVANEVAVELVTLRDCLPQGSPTSSLLANLAFLTADVQIRRALRRRGGNYSRFVDDIAISGTFDRAWLKGLLTNVVKQSRFELAENKTKIRGRSETQVVTGLVVNDKLRPTTEFIAALKADLRFCLDHSPAMLADMHGVTQLKLKSQFDGRICHYRQFNAHEADRLHRLCRYAVQWNRRVEVDLKQAANCRASELHHEPKRSENFSV